ncbi:MAG: arsC [Bacteroidetes bacterium]|nr:arsC [Bacteroidota bacterium]
MVKKNKNNNRPTQPLSLEGRAGEGYIVYHNTRCSKSREACSILEEEGVKFETIEYLKTPPTQTKIKELKMLGIKAAELVRKSEPLFREKFANKKLTETQWIKILAENPVLIERPIVVKGNKAIIGRPPEKVLELIG